MFEMGAPGRVELPTNGLGNRCSIHLSYGAIVTQAIISCQFADVHTVQDGSFARLSAQFELPISSDSRIERGRLP